MEDKSGYGKRPLWQWIVIYIIIGGIIYGLIYYFVLAKNGRYNNSNNSNIYTTPTIMPSNPPNQPTSVQDTPTQGVQQSPPTNNYKY